MRQLGGEMDEIDNGMMIGWIGLLTGYLYILASLRRG
jgi:hypothetical protein